MADRPGAFGRRALLKGGAGLVAARWLGDVGFARAETATVPPPAIVTRAEWGADESLGDRRRSFAAISKAFVHHTATDDRGATSVQQIHRYHTVSRGWSDIGYNFLVDGAGTVYEGRWARTYAAGEVHSGEDLQGRGVIGAHAGGYNTGSVGIALLGNTSVAGVSDAAMQALAEVVAWKFGSRGLDPHGASPYRRAADGETVRFPNIAGHRDVSATGCPGTDLYSRLPEIRDRVADLVTRGLVGYRILGADGSLWTYGGSETFSRTADIGDVRRNVGPGLPVRAAAGTPTGYGAWVAAADGGVHAFGDAGFFGSMGGQRLNRPIVGMAPTPSGRGYWLCASDGGMFCFGDARFFGSTGGIRLVQPVVGMAPAPNGLGYWLVARDGGVFSFGAAPFLGSAAGRVAARATAMAAAPSGRGYWVLDGTGAAHAFGDAPVFASGVTDGSRPALALVPVHRP